MMAGTIGFLVAFLALAFGLGYTGWLRRSVALVLMGVLLAGVSLGFGGIMVLAADMP